MKKLSVFITLFLLAAFSSNSFSQNSDNSLIDSKLSLTKTGSTESGMDKNLIKSHFNTGNVADFPKSLRVQPAVTVHITGGYSMPLPDYLGKIPEYNDTAVTTSSDWADGYPNTYSMKGGYNVGADVHIAFGKTGPGKRQIRLVLSGGYLKMGHSQGKTVPYKADNKWFYLGSDTTTPGVIDMNIDAITVGLGVEYAFRPWETFNPFIGLDVTGHFYSGNVYLEPAPASNYNEWNLESTSRFGLALGGGADLAFGRNFGVVLGVKWNYHNLFGKKANDSTTEASLNAGYKFGLNDDEYTSLDANGNTVSRPSKNMMDLQLYGGVSFYFGQPPRKVAK